jgi:glycosyltransferase involved in cell wall biosynthesis/ADP-heptose:LPS heptosyltransferase
VRIVIDLQGAQSESRFRGIGRYSLELSKAMVRHRGTRQIILALNGLLAESIDFVRDEFASLMPQSDIRVWYAPGHVREIERENGFRREVAELVREAFLASLEPDVILITSLFEGIGDNSVGTIGHLSFRVPVAVVLHDLIPLVNPDIHFRTSIMHKEWYARKLNSLRRARLLLANSESTRQEAITALSWNPDEIVTVSAAVDEGFRPLHLSSSERLALLTRHSISQPFVFYTGGADERKNLGRLVEAFSRLPTEIRNAHQLVIAGKIPEECQGDLVKQGYRYGLTHGQIVLPGHISNGDLIGLYNCCKLFVFPSLHEGFGLPPLEAMACGAAVIGADATSLPEVIGNHEALFDPQSVAAITDKIQQGLVDECFRNRLIKAGAIHAKNFSWDKCATIALEALDRFAPSPVANDIGRQNTARPGLFIPKNTRILIIKLDHMGDFLLSIPAIIKLKGRFPAARLDVLVGSWNRQPATALDIFDNIYCFNFFKTNSGLSPSADQKNLTLLLSQLDEYDMVIDLRRQPDTRFLLIKVRARIRVGYQTGNYEIDRHLDASLPFVSDRPFVRTELNATPISMQMMDLIDAIPQDHADSFVPLLGKEPMLPKSASIAIFPFAGNEVKEWGASRYRDLILRLVDESDVESVEVYIPNSVDADRLGQLAGPKVRISTALDFAVLLRSLSRHRVCIANNSLGSHLASYLGLRVVAIYSGHETVDEWGPPFGNSYIVHRDAPCSPCHLPDRASCPFDMFCLESISVDEVHSLVMNVFRCFTDQPSGTITQSASLCGRPASFETVMAELIAGIERARISSDGLDRLALARSIARSIPPSWSRRRLFVDISELAQRDAKTGIQRVTRNYLRQIAARTFKNYEVIPVRAFPDRVGYFHAHDVAGRLLGKSRPGAESGLPIEYYAGDIFFGLDLQPAMVPTNARVFGDMRRNGVHVIFMVHDLLCLLMPENFEPGPKEAFENWIRVVAKSDGVICVSETVAHDFEEWMRTNAPPSARPFSVRWLYSGGDLESGSTGHTPSAKERAILARISKKPIFLMVGTIEPRKNHAQTLEAFELLWSQGLDVVLVIAGKQGWLVGNLIDRLRCHSELKKRLFWLPSASDGFIEVMYKTADCLIAASAGEGFGLPLIEAAWYRLPIIARDIPVFREIAGDHAFYFTGSSPILLASAIQSWMELRSEGKVPSSAEIPINSWKDSAERLVELLGVS